MSALHSAPCDHPRARNKAAKQSVEEHAAFLSLLPLFSLGSVLLLRKALPPSKAQSSPFPSLPCVSPTGPTCPLHRLQDAKPANEYAEQAVSLTEEAERLYEDLDELGTGVKDR